MVRNNNPINITGATTLSENYKNILITASSTFTVTLSTINHDGVDYIISRIDNSLSSIVTLFTTSGVIFSTSTISSTTYIIPINTLLEIVSYDGNWYIISSKNINLKTLAPKFATTFVSNNSSTFVVMTGGNNIIDILTIVYDYTTLSLFSGAIISLTQISGNLSGTLQVISQGTGSNITFISVTLTAPVTINDYTALVSGSQFVGNIDTIIINFLPSVSTGANDKFGINSISLF